MKFAIITYILHKEHQNSYYSYEPYIREMNIWLNSPKEIIVVAPKNSAIPSSIEKAYLHNNISFRKIPAISFLNYREVFRSLIKFPRIFIQILKAMREADHIHLRCPGNIGLIACFLQIFFRNKPKTAKYAGNWDPEARKPLSYRLQKWILSNTFLTRNIQVLVYGDWADQSKNVVPFFTASFSETEKEIINKKFTAPYKFLFVGNLVPGKQPAVAFQIVESLNNRNIPVELHIYGDGELMNSLQDQAKNKAYIHLHANRPLEVLKQAYKESHFLILASKSEGWPKAIAEAMWFGCIPIATAVSCVPQMLKAPPAPARSGTGGPEGGASRVTVTERGILLPDLNNKKSIIAGSGLLDTFPKSRQFECFPDSPEGERGNVSRTGFSEIPAYRSGRLEVTESGDLVEETVEMIIELINNPEEMRRMSLEAQEWSQQYSLERFEEAIKEILAPQPPKGE